MVKRIFGVPGDVIDLLSLKYASGIPVPERAEQVITVPEHCYFVLEDNVEDSRDSRYWEEMFVDQNCIVAVLIQLRQFYHLSSYPLKIDCFSVISVAKPHAHDVQ